MNKEEALRKTRTHAKNKAREEGKNVFDVWEDEHDKQFNFDLSTPGAGVEVLRRRYGYTFE